MTNKTEKATAYKLQKAKERGQVSKSAELNTFIYLLVLVFTGSALWPALLGQIKVVMVQLIYLSSQMTLTLAKCINLQNYLFSAFSGLWLTFGIAAMLSLSLASLAQTGFVWSIIPLTPDFKRLNILQGFKRMFSSKAFFDAIKSCLKLSLIFFLLLLSLRHKLPILLKLMNLSPLEHPALIKELLIKIVLQLLACLFSLTLIDKFYSRWTFNKEQRMSKQELQDEYRQREGDPSVKTKMKVLQKKLRQKTLALNQVKTADVIITNPTHLAIALKYDRLTMPAPKVVCKAHGDLATKVKKIAKRYHIPIIQNKTLARSLNASVELNQWIQEEHFPLTAIIFRDLYQQRNVASC